MNDFNSNQLTGKKTVWKLILIVLPIVLLISAMTGFMLYIFLYSAKNTAIYRCALLEAKQNEKITEKIGLPIEPGTLVWTESWSSGGFTETAYFNTSLTGSKGTGTLYVQAQWSLDYSYLKLIFSDGGKPEVVFQGDNPCMNEE
jgi:hypothetical protein